MRLVNKLKFAVVGCGHIGKRHAAVITANKDCELVALVDRNSKDGLQMNEFEQPYFFALEDLLKSNLEVDIISIATPNGLHTTQAIQCLEAGKHVVLEKPIALTSQDAIAILQKAKEVNKMVFPVMQNRYSPISIWLKELLDSNILGEIFLTQINCFWNRDERYYKPDSWHGDKSLDGGTLFTQFAHFIDMFYWLLGDVKNVRGKLLNFNHKSLTHFEDSGLLQFKLVNGGVGTFNFSTSLWQQNMESSFTIIAENGSVKVGGQYMDKVEYCHIKDYEMPVLESANRNNHSILIENIANYFSGEKSQIPSLEEELKVIEIIEQFYNCEKLWLETFI